MDNEFMEQRLLTVKQLAKYIGYNQQTVYNMLSKSPEKLPRHLKMGSLVRFYVYDVDLWIKQHDANRPTKKIEYKNEDEFLCKIKELTEFHHEQILNQHQEISRLKDEVESITRAFNRHVINHKTT